MAVGKISFDDWPRLTSSFGCSRRASPRKPPISSEPRLASTSFMFILLCVPDPVCQTASGNSLGCLPASTSSAACVMATAFLPLNKPRSRLTWAAARLTVARAAISSGGIFSVEIWKCSSERWVCAPHNCAAGTSIGPKLSRSILLLMASLSSILVLRVYSRRQKRTGRGHTVLLSLYFAYFLPLIGDVLPFPCCQSDSPMHSSVFSRRILIACIAGSVAAPAAFAAELGDISALSH